MFVCLFVLVLVLDFFFVFLFFFVLTISFSFFLVIYRDVFIQGFADWSRTSLVHLQRKR